MSAEPQELCPECGRPPALEDAEQDSAGNRQLLFRCARDHRWGPGWAVRDERLAKPKPTLRQIADQYGKDPEIRRNADRFFAQRKRERDAEKRRRAAGRRTKAGRRAGRH